VEFGASAGSQDGADQELRRRLMRGCVEVVTGCQVHCGCHVIRVIVGSAVHGKPLWTERRQLLHRKFICVFVEASAENDQKTLLSDFRHLATILAGV
jgi:hypothetical protein